MYESGYKWYDGLTKISLTKVDYIKYYEDLIKEYSNRSNLKTHYELQLLASEFEEEVWNLEIESNIINTYINFKMTGKNIYNFLE